MTPAPTHGLNDAVLNDDLKLNDQSYTVVGLNSPAEVQEHLLGPRTVFVLADIIRCTTTLNAALAAGASYLFVEVKRDDDELHGLDRYRGLLGDDAVLVVGGEKHGKPIPGGLFGNSALEVPKSLTGASAVFFSTNAGRAYEAITSLLSPATEASVFLASMANIPTLAAAIADGDYQRVVIVSGAFYGRLSLEDAIAGGRLIRQLGIDGPGLDDGAITMTALADRFSDDEELVETLHHNRIGKALVRYGREADIAAAITGRGLDPGLQRALQHTVGHLVWLGDTPALTTYHTKEMP